MTEVLTVGPPERAPRRWTRPVTAAVGAALVVAGVVHERSDHPPGEAAAKPSHSVTIPRATLPPQPPTPPEAVGRLLGVAGRVPANVALLVGGQTPRVLGTQRSWLHRLPVRTGEAVSRILPAAGGVVVQVARNQWDPPLAGSTIYFVRRDATVVKLIEADSVVISADQRHVFTLRAGPQETSRARVVELDLRGRVVHRWLTSPRLSLAGDSPDGLLATQIADEPSSWHELRILDHRTLAPRRSLGSVAWVVSATERTVAAMPSGCGENCPLLLIDVANGSRHQLPTVPGFDVGALAFSPDASKLAVGYLGRHSQQPGGAAPGFVDVIDVSSGFRQRVPGVGSGTKHTAELAWLPDGRSLALGVDLADDVSRIGLWPLRGGRVQLVPGTFSPGGLLAV